MKLSLLIEQEPTADLSGQTLLAPAPATDKASPEQPGDALGSEVPGRSAVDSNPESVKAERTIKTIEKLQDAAVALEAARFAMQQDYSDFSLAKKLEIIKQEVVSIIGKAKEHVMQTSTKSPEAEKIVSGWLEL